MSSTKCQRVLVLMDGLSIQSPVCMALCRLHAWLMKVLMYMCFKNLSHVFFFFYLTLSPLYWWNYINLYIACHYNKGWLWTREKAFSTLTIRNNHYFSWKMVTQWIKQNYISRTRCVRVVWLKEENKCRKFSMIYTFYIIYIFIIVQVFHIND